MQKYLEKEDRLENEILLSGTLRSIDSATLELSEINSVVLSQGEIIRKIQEKINQTEITLKRASKKLSVLLRRSKNRKLLSVCLLFLTTASVLTLCIYTYKHK